MYSSQNSRYLLYQSQSSFATTQTMFEPHHTVVCIVYVCKFIKRLYCFSYNYNQLKNLWKTIQKT